MEMKRGREESKLKNGFCVGLEFNGIDGRRRELVIGLHFRVSSLE